MYILYVCDEFWEVYYIHHITWHVSQIMHFCITFPVVCNYSTHCTLIVLSPDPEMMVVSLMSTAHTHSLCPLSVILSVMSVGDLTFHTPTVLSCRHKHTHHSNDNDEHRPM